MQLNKALRDYRFYARMPLRLEAEISVQQWPVGCFRVRDIDMGGLFVETRDADLYPNDVVDIVFIGSNGAESPHNFRARVVRHSPDGVGLMFLDYDQASLGALLEVMVAAKERLLI